jgi:hypothetical protein
MKDIFWTIIVIWLIYKLVDIFRSAGTKKKYAYQQNENYTNTTSNAQSQQSATFTKKDVKSALQKRADKEGEYVDFEEIK